MHLRVWMRRLRFRQRDIITLFRRTNDAYNGKTAGRLPGRPIGSRAMVRGDRRTGKHKSKDGDAIPCPRNTPHGDVTDLGLHRRKDFWSFRQFCGYRPQKGGGATSTGAWRPTAASKGVATSAFSEEAHPRTAFRGYRKPWLGQPFGLLGCAVWIDSPIPNCYHSREDLAICR